MSTQSPEDHEIDALFERALELEGADREQLLDKARREHPRTAAAVTELLRHAMKPAPELGPEALFSGPLWDDFASGLEEAEALPPVERIGPYRVMEQIGRGGMGVVYRAVRDDGEFDQQVAIKLVQPGADRDNVLRRFEQERQILAALEDSNIARLYDGGRHDDGRPYFAMEYVDGIRLDRYCDQHHLSVNERLDLFVQVARAVQHAHSRLVVHRDIKPSNILVTSKGNVKLLDFGIAKVLTPEDSGSAELTQTAARVLTPDYASPEQVLGQPIGTASDVYQLGLLLFELLTGQRTRRVDKQSPSALRQAITEAPTKQPSTAVAEAGDPRLGELRATTTQRLRRMLQGELDVIVLRALDRDPERRYRSADALADDIECFRRGLPIEARPDTLGYRARRFAGRHRTGVAAALMFAVLVIGWAVTGTIQNARLAEERDAALVASRKAKETQDLLFGLFREADPFSAKGADLKALDVLRSGMDVVRAELAEQPQVRAEMLSALAGILQDLDQKTESRAALEEALATLREVESPSGEATAATLHRLSTNLGDSGEREAAEAADREGLAIRRRLYGERHPLVANSLHGLAISLYRQRQYDGAEALLSEALAIHRAADPEDPVRTGVIMNDLAVMLGILGRLEEAISLHREAIALRRRLFPSGHAAIAESANNLGSILDDVGQLEESEALLREAVEARRAGLGEHHIRVANALGNLGTVLRRLRRLDEAEEVQLEALSIRRRNLGDEHSNVAISLHALGLVQRQRGDLATALETFRSALEMFRRTRPDAHRRPVASLIEIGAIKTDTGRLDEAEGLLRDALAEAMEHLGVDHWVTALAQLELGRTLVARGRATEARPLLERAATALESARGPDDELTQRAQSTLSAL